MGGVIIGTGMAVPDNMVTNEGLTRIMDTSDEWISSRTGVRERRFVDEGVGSAALGTQVAHQANERILEGVRKQLAMGGERVPSIIAGYGNTTPGTLPILFHELRKAGRVTPGTVVCFTAFGAGAHWGALIYREPH